MNQNNIEIERRWLLTKFPDGEDFFAFLHIVQYYTPEGRFRKTTDMDHSDQPKYYKTNKKEISHGVNEEFENEISESDFLTAIETATKFLTKARCISKHDSLFYEFDLIHAKIYILEIELNSIDQVINIPDHIQDCIIREITGEKEYTNYNLAKVI